MYNECCNNLNKNYNSQINIYLSSKELNELTLECDMNITVNILIKELETNNDINKIKNLLRKSYIQGFKQGRGY